MSKRVAKELVKRCPLRIAWLPCLPQTLQMFIFVENLGTLREKLHTVLSVLSGSFRWFLPFISSFFDVYISSLFLSSFLQFRIFMKT